MERANRTFHTTLPQWEAINKMYPELQAQTLKLSQLALSGKEHVFATSFHHLILICFIQTLDQYF